METGQHVGSGTTGDEAGADRRALFTQQPVPSSWEPQEIDRVLGFSLARRYRVGEVISRKGDAGDGMMIVFAGQVKIGVFGADGKEAVLGADAIALKPPVVVRPLGVFR